MAGSGIRFDGLDVVRRNLRTVSRETPRGLTAIHREIAEPVADRARSKVRSRSGKLARSIRVNASQRYARVSAGARLPYPYAPINHYGGYPGAYVGNPFLSEAIHELTPRTLASYDQLLTKFVDSVWIDTR